MAKETSRHDLGESTTSGTEMETSPQGLVAAFELSAQAVTDRSTYLPQVTLSPADIPGADLSEGNLDSCRK